MLKFLQKLRRIVRQYDTDRVALLTQIRQVHNRLGEHTTVHMDLCQESPSQIIVIGQYRNRDYVHVFNVDEESFLNIIERLRTYEPNAKLGRCDVPPLIPFSSVYPHERL